MKFLWEKEYKTNRKKTIIGPAYILKKNDIYYVFKEYDNIREYSEYLDASEITIRVLRINSLTGEYIEYSKDLSFSKAVSSKEFHLEQKDNNIILYVGKYLNITEYDIIQLPDSYQEYIEDKIKEYKIPNEYCFDNLILKYNGKATIECYERSNKKLLWKYILRLFKSGNIAVSVHFYSEIEYKNGHIMFLTCNDNVNKFDFCCIELLTGIVKIDSIRLCDKNYKWDNETIFLIDESGSLLQISPYEKDKILQKIDFVDGKMESFKIYNDCIYGVINGKRKKKMLVCLKK